MHWSRHSRLITLSSFIPFEYCVWSKFEFLLFEFLFDCIFGLLKFQFYMVHDFSACCLYIFFIFTDLQNLIHLVFLFFYFKYYILNIIRNYRNNFRKKRNHKYSKKTKRDLVSSIFSPFFCLLLSSIILI